MILRGIKTHNLKNLDFETCQPEIIGICGVSGGGKSSFAYHTLYAICADTFQALENGYAENSTYVLDSYSHLLPSIAIKQLNLNTNPRSSIYSYMNLPSILSILNEIPYHLLKLNKPSNECPNCQGRGYISAIKEDLVIDYDKKICDIPFIPWTCSRYGNDCYELLLLEFCKYQHIDTNTKFKDLSPQEQQLLLYARDDSKSFTIKFKHNKKPRTRHLNYLGILQYMDMLLKSDKVSDHNEVIKYCADQMCPVCLGARVNVEQYEDIFIGKLSFIDFLTRPFEELFQSLQTLSRQDMRYQRLCNILESCCKLGIGYLSFNRSIPALSGGELQKIHFSSLIHANMSNLMIVIDEISSGLHVSDFENVASYINILKQNFNTIVLVEHNPFFLEKCDRVIQIGPVGGKQGGYIVEANFVRPPLNHPTQIVSAREYIEFSNINIHNINNQSVSIPLNALTAIIGKSGSGKSSLAKYIESHLDSCVYVSQKTLRGNIKSNIATYSGVGKSIAEYFAKEFRKDSNYFTSNGGSEITCERCNGAGVIKYERSFESSISIVCPQCNGKMFNEKSQQFLIDDKSISDLYDAELSTLQASKISKLKTMSAMATTLSLGHLSLNRKIDTLSGGEIKRLKILKSLLGNLSKKILIIDEPGSGLDLQNALNVLQVLRHTKTLATVIVEHNPYLFLQADYIIEMGPEAGCKGGQVIFNDKASIYYDKFMPMWESLK